MKDDREQFPPLGPPKERPKPEPVPEWRPTGTPGIERNRHGQLRHVPPETKPKS